MALLTTSEAALLIGVTPEALRSIAFRARQVGVDLRVPRQRWNDRRSPLYDSDLLQQWMSTRPGSGRRLSAKGV